KQLHKGLKQLAEEGAVQVFFPLNNNDVVLGAVGTLQFDVVAHRLKHEYGVDCVYDVVNVATARWIEADKQKDLDAFRRRAEQNLAMDGADHLTYLAPTRVNLQLAEERHPEIRFRDIREILPYSRPSDGPALTNKRKRSALMEYLSIGIGGIGLFLWGLWLITEGLRQAAGSSLDRILTSWTSSRLKGLLAGTLLTAAVQSSSVVTMAIIGFANAGLITFQRAVWMMFGSNPGTTATAWIVALVGFKFQIDALALPIIGLGALWRVLGRTERGKSMGEAISGLGLLLLGIEVLSTGFSSLGAEVQLGQEYGVLVMVLVGIVLASIVMSSAVPVALVLTALASGSISMVDAAAVVIGANMGTSFKSILVVIGATSNARRLAAAHVF